MGTRTSGADGHAWITEGETVAPPPDNKDWGPHGYFRFSFFPYFWIFGTGLMWPRLDSDSMWPMITLSCLHNLGLST